MSTTVSSVDVATIAAGLAAVSVHWDLGVDTPPSSRRYERSVLATDAYDAWLIYWPAGTSIGVHDHGDSVGALAVVAGALEEDALLDGRTRTSHVSLASRSLSPRIGCTRSSTVTRSPRRVCTSTRRLFARWASTARNRTASSSSTASKRQLHELSDRSTRRRRLRRASMS